MDSVLGFLIWFSSDPLTSPGNSYAALLYSNFCVVLQLTIMTTLTVKEPVEELLF
jgi:hypothetical protein